MRVKLSVRVSHRKHSSAKLPQSRLQKPLMPFKVGQWTESLIEDLNHRPELNMIDSHQRVNVHLGQVMQQMVNKIPNATGVVGIIGKINVGSAMFGALIVVSPAMFLVAVLLRRSTNRWRHVKPTTLRREYIRWRRRHTGLEIWSVAVRRWPSRGQLKTTTLYHMH